MKVIVCNHPCQCGVRHALNLNCRGYIIACSSRQFQGLQRNFDWFLYKILDVSIIWWAFMFITYVALTLQIEDVSNIYHDTEACGNIRSPPSSEKIIRLLVSVLRAVLALSLFKNYRVHLILRFSIFFPKRPAFGWILQRIFIFWWEWDIQLWFFFPVFFLFLHVNLFVLLVGACGSWFLQDRIRPKHASLWSWF